jgi:hypothetical protein
MGESMGSFAGVVSVERRLRMRALSGSREPSPSSTGLGPSGFDPARYGLSEGAVRALMKHTRVDGALNEGVLGAEDAEELWFCSMVRATTGGKRLCTREARTSGISGSTHFIYSLTAVGRAIHNAIATEARRAATVEQGAVHEGAGPKDIAQPLATPPSSGTQS